MNQKTISNPREKEPIQLLKLWLKSGNEDEDKSLLKSISSNGDRAIFSEILEILKNDVIFTSDESEAIFYEKLRLIYLTMVNLKP